MQPPRGDRVLVMGLMLFFFGCATAVDHKSVGNTDLQQETFVKPIDSDSPLDLAPMPLPLPPQESEIEVVEAQEPSESEVPETNHQRVLDSALEYCQASNELWERGDLEGAVDALDTAYSLILTVDTEEDPELVQQKEDIRFTISKRIIEAYASRLTTAQGNHNAIPLTMNDHVQKALASFQGRERDFFLGAYRRSGKYRPAIVKAFNDAGLPEELSWLPLIESGFKVRALSRARALGLWQFIASTGYKFGLKRDHWVDERMDPEKSTRAAIAYLQELHQMFGDWTTVLAAYNCGEWAVLRRIRSQRINYLDNFWDLYELLPRETASYVPRFLAVLHILQDPEAYGFNLPPLEEPPKMEEVTINKQVHLKTIAERLESDYNTLEDLNPELRHNYTPPSSYALRVPPGKGEVLLAKLDDIPAWRPPASSHYVHRVRSGDSLSSLATRYKTSVSAIMRANNLRNAHYLKVGWNVRIPTRAGIQAPSQLPAGQTAKTAESVGTHVVKRGDSLWKIASSYGTTVRTIQSLNGLKGSRLKVGQVIKVPRGPETAFPQHANIYRVKEGDSPYLIAHRHRMSLADLLRINNLSPGATIYPGQTLMVR
ncbi:MAG: LysM peptidoglycan-binding domain-containing protein [Desulfatiglandales bacterium]